MEGKGKRDKVATSTKKRCGCAWRLSNHVSCSFSPDTTISVMRVCCLMNKFLEAEHVFLVSMRGNPDSWNWILFGLGMDGLGLI